MTRHRYPRPARLLGVALTCAVGSLTLAGCTGTPTLSAQARVADAVDSFYADNTGSYTLAAVGLQEEGRYQVSPDSLATLRRVLRVDGTLRSTARYLRLNSDVWLELPAPADGADSGAGRSGCWATGTTTQIDRIEGRPTGTVPLSTPAIEVVLGLRNGREDDQGLLADASLRTVAEALGRSAVRDLEPPQERVDVPVRLEVEGSRVTRWEVSVADLVAASPGGADSALAGETGSVVATFAEPGADLAFDPPTEETATLTRAGDQPGSLEDLAERCVEPPSGPGGF